MKSTKSVLFLALFLTLAACGGDDEGSTTTTAGESSSGASVVIEGFAFSEVSDVAVGEEITVVNNDATAHTWTSNDGSFDSGSIAAGDTFSFTFDSPGEYSFFCGIHPTMTGSITVAG